MCLVYGTFWALGLLLRCFGENDGCVASDWSVGAAFLFALAVPVVVFVAGWRVWRQPRGVLRAIIETVLALVLLTVLAIVLLTVVPVDPDMT